MEVTGIIVQLEESARDGLLKTLADMPHISIYSVKDNQIVLVIDTDDIYVLTQKTKEIQEMNGVIGVYPVFSLDSLPF